MSVLVLLMLVHVAPYASRSFSYWLLRVRIHFMSSEYVRVWIPPLMMRNADLALLLHLMPIGGFEEPRFARCQQVLRLGSSGPGGGAFMCADGFERSVCNVWTTWANHDVR